MTDLTKFLLARIAEDEALARKAARVHVHPGANDEIASRYWDQIADPDRVLVECGARRRIVALHTEAEPGAHECPGRFSSWSVAEGDPCPTLQLLALPYSDHPDYREDVWL